MDGRLCYSAVVSPGILQVLEGPKPLSERHIFACASDTTTQTLSHFQFQIPRYFWTCNFCAFQGNLVMMKLAKKQPDAPWGIQSAILRQEAHRCSPDDFHTFIEPRLQPVAEPDLELSSHMRCVGVAVNLR